MITVKDFAQQHGCGESIVYRHIRNHREALGDRVQKVHGKTWLTDEGTEYIRALMQQQPVVVAERDEEAERWRRKYEETMENYAAYMQHAAPLLEAAAGQTLLLEQSNARVEALEAQNASLSTELGQARERASQAEERAQAAASELTAAQQRIRELEGRTWWQLLFKKKG